jgi:hypothetical protein
MNRDKMASRCLRNESFALADAELHATRLAELSLRKYWPGHQLS